MHISHTRSRTGRTTARKRESDNVTNARERKCTNVSHFKKKLTHWKCIYSAAITVTVGFACLSIVFSLLACVLDTNKEIGGNWWNFFVSVCEYKDMRMQTEFLLLQVANVCGGYMGSCALPCHNSQQGNCVTNWCAWVCMCGHVCLRVVALQDRDYKERSSIWILCLPMELLDFFLISHLYSHTQGAESGSMATYWAYFTTGWTVQGVLNAIQQSNFFLLAGLFYLVSMNH